MTRIYVALIILDVYVKYLNKGRSCLLNIEVKFGKVKELAKKIEIVAEYFGCVEQRA